MVPGRSTVFLINLFAIPTGRISETIIENDAIKRIEYPDYEGVQDAGWVVD